MKAPTIAITHERENWDWGPDLTHTCNGSLTIDNLARLLEGGRVECGVCYQRLDPADWAEDDDLPLARALRVKALPPEGGS